MTNGERKILRTIERANQRVRRYLAEHLDRLDITEIEAHLLARLAARGPCSVADMYRAFGLRRSTLTNALDRLERRGLITRRTDPDDRRSFLLALTASGTRAAREVIALVDALEARVRSGVSRPQIEAFHAVVETLERALG
jgi:DNA-binding MarR family transcriptional regulator